MRKLAAGILIILLIFAIAGYFLYPVISDQLGRRRDSGIMQDYRAKTAQMSSEQREKLFGEAKAWNESLEEIRVEDVFMKDNQRTTRDYQNHMNVHDGVIAELVIPDIGVTLPVFHQSTETPANLKLVHVNTSSLPGDGSRENIVLAGPGVLRAEGFLSEIGLTDADDSSNDKNRNPKTEDDTRMETYFLFAMLASAGLGDLDLTPEEGDEKLTLITQRKDQRLLVQTERIPIWEARTLLAETDRVSFPADWQNVLFLGFPVLLAGLLVLWVIEIIKGRAYRLPGEGRKADQEQREKNVRETIEQIETEISEGEEP